MLVSARLQLTLIHTQIYHVLHLKQARGCGIMVSEDQVLTWQKVPENKQRVYLTPPCRATVPRGCVNGHKDGRQLSVTAHPSMPIEDMCSPLHQVTKNEAQKTPCSGVGFLRF